MKHRFHFTVAVIFIIFVSASIIVPRYSSGVGIETPFKKILSVNEPIGPRATKSYAIETLGKLCSLSVSVPIPSAFGDSGTIEIKLKDGAKIIASKPLHIGDPDLYLTFRANHASLELLSNTKETITPKITVLGWPETKNPNVEAEPNDSWQEANEFKLGQTMFATADDISYIAPLNADTATMKRGYQQTAEYEDKLPEGGVDWFKFTYDRDQPSLVHFEIELLERDNIPVDVSIFSIQNNQAVPYERGADPVTPPHEVQALPGNKFTARVISKGTYYVRVEARHPAYQLRTYVYDVPTYNDPRQAVRAGMDYIVSAGDSWHANTPRHGGIVNRVSSTHNETQNCVACHATHFPLRAELIAKKNGYEINKRSAVQFLTERFYNSPRPFYGFPDASWTRVISASANVMSRMAGLLNLYETEVTGEKHTDYLKGVVNYLKLYYKGRTTLPNDESNGNTPLVSTYEVAWYSWKAFDEYAKQANDAESIQYRDLVRKLIEQDRHKNLIDLCYQTIALVEIDRIAFADKIKKNSERILSLQRPDGQWSMLFEEGSAPVEFQTGHCLYTLAVAGYTPENPQIKKSVDFLLSRQQEWGGWFDPRQSYENFRTPFRETQFAVMALSQLYPGSNKEKGWNAAKLDNFSKDPYLTLNELNDVWKPQDQISFSVFTKDNDFEDPLLTRYRYAAYGRSGARDLSGLNGLYGQNKMVQLASSWALRQRQNGFADYQVWLAAQVQLEKNKRKDDPNYLSQSERMEWGILRIFSQHFSALIYESEFEKVNLEFVVNSLEKSNLPTVQMQSAKSLSQWYYWTKNESLRWKIVDEVILRLATETHPWVRRNLIEALYTMADENVRYLYNNWIALLAQPEDRERAKQGHRNNSLQMAKRIATALENGNELQRQGLLQAISEFHLRAGGYANGGRYTRIGNDIENIQFYDEGAKLIEKSLVPLISSSHLKIRKQAIIAANTVRDQSLDSLPLLVLQQLNDANAEIRNAAQETYRLLPLQIREQNKQQAIGILKALLASQYSPAQNAALERLRNFSPEEVRAEKLDLAVRDFVLKADRKVAPAAILALADFINLSSDAEIQARLVAALKSSEEPILRAAVQLGMSKSAWRATKEIASSLNTILGSNDSGKRRMVLGLISESNASQEDLGLKKILVESFSDKNDQVRAAAMSATRRVPALLKDSEIKAGLAKLMTDPNQSLQEQAVAFYQGQDTAYLDGAAAVAKATARISTTPTASLDYKFFTQKVMPLLAMKGKDGNACLNCHYNHTVLKLNLPNADGNWTNDQMQENFRSALRVVDTANPENSLLLRKPLGNADVEGQVGAKKVAHGGGQRWTGIDDAAYRTILDWINGEKIIAGK